MRYVWKKTGMILIFTLWALGLLVVFAIYLGHGVRQRIIFVRQIEQRQAVASAAESGIRKSVSVVHSNQYENRQDPSRKQLLMNNPEDFKDIDIQDALVSVSYDIFDKTFKNKTVYYGMIPEEGKLNINTATASEMVRLFRSVLRWASKEAEDLALSIIDWREIGESRIEGFFSDRYYANLRYPYQAKDDLFESIDELLLVKGMTPEALNKLSSFITIFGDGRVDVNVASWHVLVALGFSELIADEVISVRRGADRIEATKDDVVFLSPEHFKNIMSKRPALSDRDIQQVIQIIERQKIQTESAFYAIHAQATTRSRNPRFKSINAVYDSINRKFVYWREE